MKIRIHKILHRLPIKVDIKTVKHNEFFRKCILQLNEYNRERYIKQRNRVAKGVEKRKKTKMKNYSAKMPPLDFLYIVH